LLSFRDVGPRHDAGWHGWVVRLAREVLVYTVSPMNLSIDILVG
jgi:hypothetical protein